MAKEFKWKGKSEEEMKTLDLDTFMTLIPARQRRTLKRGFTDAQKALLKRIDAGDSNIKTHCRNMVILPKMIGMTISIYNGKEFKRLDITSEMVGHFLGEFSLSRKMVTHSSAGVGATRSSKAVSAR
jgi:small subunit ribosomal protein S19